MTKINGNHHSDKEKPELIYIYDALCGWCYGFSPVVSRLFTEFNADLDFLVLSAGMVKDESAGPIRQVAGYIQNSLEIVENTTGVRFGEKFKNDVLAKGEAVFSSEPPARALAAFRLERPDDAIAFAAKIQKEIYFAGMQVDDFSRYATMAADFGLDASTFVETMNSDEIKEIVSNEFKMVETMGVKAYPALVLRKGDEMELLMQGYKDFETMKGIIQQAVKK